jgi:hypothetical protein
MDRPAHAAALRLAKRRHGQNGAKQQDEEQDFHRRMSACRRDNALRRGRFPLLIKATK